MVGLSGGVDSSLSTLILRDQGRKVAALFMNNWDEPSDQEHCPALQDAADARAVADLLGVPLYIRQFSAEYWERVFEHFLRELAAGRTPNPDILCNREIKFDVFVQHARELGYPRIATGHYARSVMRDGRARLLRGRDRRKDQSYFLYAIESEQLALAEFPLGDLEKGEVRSRAAAACLPTARKKDSTGICFIGEQAFGSFLARHMQPSPGDIVHLEGRVLGRHRGLAWFTLGQRNGLGIGGLQGASEGPWYVLGKRLEDRQLVVGQGHQHAAMQSTRLLAEQLHFFAGSAPAAGCRLSAKTRYRQADQLCTVLESDSGTLRLQFDDTQRAVTPGQSVVLYDGEECLGGGVIAATNAQLDPRRTEVP